MKKILLVLLISILLTGCKSSPILNDTPPDMMPETNTVNTGAWILGTPIEQNDITVRPGDEFYQVLL